MSQSIASPTNPKIGFSNPTKECDLVMKGGITSGIIYPPAILKLATEYRFRNIGGTSAGAIAAAATAAAEYRRSQGQGNQAFAILEGISNQLGGYLDPDPKPTGGRITFLQSLFQPSKATKPLFEIGLSLVTERPQSRNKTKIPLISQFNRLTALLASKVSPTFTKGARLGIFFALLTALLLTSLSFLVFFLFDGEPSVPGFLVLLLVYSIPLVLIVRPMGGAIASLQELHRILRNEVVQKNGFGLCPGTATQSNTYSGKALIEWLHEDVINKLANKPLNSPLTFGDLKGDPTNAEDDIVLNMVTSNLSRNRPYVLPFQAPKFIFNENEFLRLFPQEVVKYLKDNAPNIGKELGEGYHFLPVGDAMPVLVATRMSLSFPLLFSAIPLYTIPDHLKENAVIHPSDLQRNWFSDGGIASNFPIHFFDSWIPGRPTFGINLNTWQEVDSNQTDRLQDPLSYALNRPADPSTTHKEVELPLADLHGTDIDPFFQKLDNNLLAFLGAIFSTSQNYRDSMQATLPSYRERIVQIYLKDDEGGLNLNMPPQTIDCLKRRGARAGEVLLTEFQFEQHQWVRLKVMAGLLEERLRSIANTVQKAKFNYQELLQHQKDPALAFPFAEVDQAWLDNAFERLKALQELVEKWQKLDTAPDDIPPTQSGGALRGFAQIPPLTMEKPILRVTPDL